MVPKVCFFLQVSSLSTTIQEISNPLKCIVVYPIVGKFVKKMSVRTLIKGFGKVNYFDVGFDIPICLFVLRFYGPVNPMGSCRARSVYLTTR